MAFFSGQDDHMDINRQLAALQKEMTALSRVVSKRGKAAYRGASHEASELYDDLSDRFADALPAIRKSARQVEDTIRENPGRTIAAVGLGALLITAAVLISGRSR